MQADQFKEHDRRQGLYNRADCMQLDGSWASRVRGACMPLHARDGGHAAIIPNDMDFVVVSESNYCAGQRPIVSQSYD